MPIFNIDTSDDEAERELRIYPREILVRLGSRTDNSSTEPPPWTSQVLVDHPDCGHIIFPFVTEAQASEDSRDQTLPWDQEIFEELKQSRKSIEEQIKHLCERLELSEERKSLLKSLTDEIEENLQCEFPNCKVFPYGSFSSGFAFDNCDLDVYADLGLSGIDDWSAQARTRQVADILRLNERFRSATAITKARVPIVKIKDRRSGIRCDVNTASLKGVKNSEFLNFCKNYDKRVDQLVKIVKYFSIKHEIISSGAGPHFNSYTIVIMVIFFLQSKDILPSVASLQENVQEENYENCNFAFNKELERSPSNTQDISGLFEDFFEFYASFPFSSEVISPQVGRAVEKDKFSQGEDQNLNRKLKTYKDVVVQDPFELERNLAQNVSHCRLRHFISASMFGSRVMKEVRSGISNLYEIFDNDD